jgi:hypothetical protein
MAVLLPDKQVSLESSLISQAANFYLALPPESQVPRAWAICKMLYERVTFERFTLMLDVLYALQLISLEEDTIVRLREAHAA